MRVRVASANAKPQAAKSGILSSEAAPARRLHPEAAMSRCLSVVVIFCLAVGAAAQERPKAGGPGQPLTPAAAQQQFRLPAGLRIELVAAEPTVQSPVAMAF